MRWHRTLWFSVVLALTFISSLAHAQMRVSAAPAGPAKAVALAAIQQADHPCGTVNDAVRTQDGGIRAVCSNGEVYRVFTVQGKTVAMKCSAVVKLGVSGC
jgi:hypothetical protein